VKGRQSYAITRQPSADTPSLLKRYRYATLHDAAADCCYATLTITPLFIAGYAIAIFSLIRYHYAAAVTPMMPLPMLFFFFSMLMLEMPLR